MFLRPYSIGSSQKGQEPCPTIGQQVFFVQDVVQPVRNVNAKNKRAIVRSTIRKSDTEKLLFITDSVCLHLQINQDHLILASTLLQIPPHKIRFLYISFIDSSMLVYKILLHHVGCESLLLVLH